MVHDPGVKWLAGFFEGEGCIAAHITPSRKLSCGVPQTRVDVTVGTVHKEEPILFKNHFDCGSINKMNGSPRQKPVYRWAVYGQDARSVLEELKPHLIGVKAEMAELAIEFFKSTEGGPGGGNPAVSRDEAEKRLGLVNQIRKLSGDTGVSNEN